MRGVRSQLYTTEAVFVGRGFKVSFKGPRDIYYLRPLTKPRLLPPASHLFISGAPFSQPAEFWECWSGSS